MKRLLCIISAMNTGGAETFLMKVYRNLDPTKYQFDFCINSENEGYYEKEIIERGGLIHRIPAKSKHPIAAFTAICKLVRKNNYHYVMRVNEHSLSTLDLLAAKIGGAKVLVMRSSNANSGSDLSIALHKLFSFLPKIVPTVKLAPSIKAAEYTFGKGCVANGKATLLNNGVDLSVFHYSKDSADSIKKEFSIEDKLIIGHIGRFNHQKNHPFLLDVFKEIKDKHPNAVLMLVGGGEKETEIKQQALSLGISDSIIFTGIRSDIPALLSAMDVFVFPSFFEGMPNTVIEAQATGLPCVISDTITNEADITGLVKYLPLGDKNLWANTTLNLVSDIRKDTKVDFVENGYDIETATKQFIKSVFKEGKKI